MPVLCDVVWLDTGSDVNRSGYLPLRFAVSVAMLAFLASRVRGFSWTDIVPSLNAVTILWLVGAGLFTLAGYLVSIARWHQVLIVLELPARMGRLATHYLAAQFVSNALPTTIGGDLVRVRRLSRENDDQPGTIASVVLERMTGWFVLPLVSLTGLAINPGLSHDQAAARLAIWTAVVTLLGLSVALVVAQHPHFGGRARNWRGIGRFMDSIALALRHLKVHPRTAVSVLAVGVLYALVLIGAAYMSARALQLEAIGLTALLAFYPAVLILQVLPVGISGLGVREAALAVFLVPLGIEVEQAIAFGIFLYILNLAISLVGVPAFTVGKRKMMEPTLETM